MPYKSKAQQAYFNANRTKMEAQGVNVDEWNKASKGKMGGKPEHVHPPGHSMHPGIKDHMKKGHMG